MENHLVILQFPLFFAIALLATLLTLGLSLYAWQHRGARGAPSFALLMLATTLWTGSIAAGMAAPTQELSYLWAILRMAGVIATPVLWLIFAVRFAQVKRLNRPLFFLLLSLLPWVSFILMATNQSHHFFVQEIQWQQNGPFLVDTLWVLGPWFPIHLVYSYTLILIGDYLILREAYHLIRQFRGQALALFLGTVFPMLINLSFTFHLIPRLTVNYDPLGFVLAGIAFSSALFQFRLFDLMPIARRFLVDEMRDGLLVIDHLGRLVDINPAAQAMFEIDPQGAVGKPATQWLPPIWTPHLLSPTTAQKPFELAYQHAVYEVRITPLSMNQKYIGRLILCHDITQRKTLESQLLHLSRTDALTQVCNRRYFIQLAENELVRSHRYQHDLALILMDCDLFKDINDRYGHLTGDQALVALAQLCQENLRTTDVLARYGGEEFMILCPESDAHKAWNLAERLRATIEATPLQTDKARIALTASMGVVSLDSAWETSLETLLERADQALYRSKNAGRNRVTLWQPGPDD